MASGIDPAALRAARERAGLTQHELARLVDVAGGERVSRWERGSSVPKPDILLRLAEVLGLRPPELLATRETGAADLRTLRIAAGLSAAEIAAAVHISRRTYVRWEGGRWARLPSEQYLRALASLLRASPADVVAALQHSKLTGP